MSRSLRVPATYVACGADPGVGKSKTSRSIRHRVRQDLRVEAEDFDFVHVQDKIRGDAGTRSRDYGWKFFGDGRYSPSWNKEWREKLSRK